ncbi:hypothetical protein [Streptomyces sp. NPDC001851]|uniref:hypothetical protein n=1 Tax=Streptomyces sp. NPDC001851 TaxID=3154529 RepID=UPI0033319FB2
MPSLPPVLGVRRTRSDQSGDTAPDGSGAFDDALDDAELHTARAALAQGRRQAARSLLLHTGDDWDRRGHRLTVLAREPYAVAWAGEWLHAEPGSADAATLYALAQVQRALRGKEDPDRARDACAEAAALAPADPTPWLGLLQLARALGPEREVLGAFAELSRRHPEHHHAHHLLLARLAERPSGGRAAEDHEVYDLAELAAAEAPADSPLALLPVVALAERHRVLVPHRATPAPSRRPARPPAAPAGSPSTSGTRTSSRHAGTTHRAPLPDGQPLPAGAPAAAGPAPAACGHWSGPRARRILRAGFDWWLEWEHDEHPRRHIDLNHLAFALSCAGRPAEAAALFQRIGRHATPAPWSFVHSDPLAAFRAARTRALGH